MKQLPEPTFKDLRYNLISGEPCGNEHDPEWWCPQCKKILLLSSKGVEMARSLEKMIKYNGKNDKECLEFCSIARDPDDLTANLIIPTYNGDKLCNVGDFIAKFSDGSYTVFEQQCMLTNIGEQENEEKDCYGCELYCLCSARIAVDEFLTKLTSTGLNLPINSRELDLYKLFGKKCKV